MNEWMTLISGTSFFFIVLLILLFLCLFLFVGTGLSNVDRKRLCAEVNIIFHSAATVRFNERLKVAARVNAIATWNLLEMCKQMPLLKVI